MIDDSVTRKGRATAPMTKHLRAALTETRRGALTDYVIEYGSEKVASIKKGFAGAVARAGLDAAHRSRLDGEASMSTPKIANHLGHLTSRVTKKVYARFSLDHLRSAGNVLDLTFYRKVQTDQ